jgi:hypothetical protein
MDDVDLHRWFVAVDYHFRIPEFPPPGVESCTYSGSLHLSRWIHNPQGRDGRQQTADGREDVPNLTAGDKDRLAAWLDAYPMQGMYIAVNGELLSLNPGSEANGGRDIQEKMPPDETPDGDEFTAPPFLPSGKYLYYNDRNAPVRGDKQIPSDRAWNFDCVPPNRGGGNMTISLSAKSLDDLAAAPAALCQGKRPVLGIEGTNRGRVVIGGNGVMFVFDSNFGRMDYETSKMCRLG